MAASATKFLPEEPRLQHQLSIAKQLALFQQQNAQSYAEAAQGQHQQTGVTSQQVMQYLSCMQLPQVPQLPQLPGYAPDNQMFNMLALQVAQQQCAHQYLAHEELGLRLTHPVLAQCAVHPPLQQLPQQKHSQQQSPHGLQQPVPIIAKAAVHPKALQETPTVLSDRPAWLAPGCDAQCSVLLQARVDTSFSLFCLVNHDANMCKCSFCTVAPASIAAALLLLCHAYLYAWHKCVISGISTMPRFLVNAACYNVTDEAQIDEDISSPSRCLFPFGLGCKLHWLHSIYCSQPT